MGRSERLTALLLFADGPAVLITPSFEAENHRRDALVDDVVTWNEEEDPIPLAAKTLGKARTLGIEGTTAYGTASKLLSAAPLQARRRHGPLRRPPDGQDRGGTGPDPRRGAPHEPRDHGNARKALPRRHRE